MGREYIVGDAQIKIIRQAAFAVALPGELHMQVLTVAEALRANSKGQNAFNTHRGTIDVRAELAIPDVDPRSYLGRTVQLDRKYNLCYVERDGEGCGRG